MLLAAQSEGRRRGLCGGGHLLELAQFLNCAAVSTIIFAPASLPLATGIQHSLLGFVVTQIVVTKLSGRGPC